MSVPSANGWEGTCVIALSLGYLLLGYQTRFRLAGARITGSRQKLASPAWQERWQGQGRQLGNARCCWRPGSSGIAGRWGQVVRGSMPWLGFALDTCPLGYTPRCPLGSCQAPVPPCRCPSIHPSCSTAPALQQEHQRGQGPHMKEKCLHLPHARNICLQGVCTRGPGRFYIGCFSGMGPQMRT